MIHTTSLADILPQRWRNGGGHTQELLTWPESAHWLLRISVARIEQHGPFSAYPGVERWFAVIAGDGVALQFGSSNIALKAESEPLQFDGAAAPGCALLTGATQDLNLMVKRDRGHGAMRRVTVCTPWLSAATFRAVYAADSTTLMTDEYAALLVPAGTLVWNDDAADQLWQLTDDGHGAAIRAWWIEVTPRTDVPAVSSSGSHVERAT